MNEISRKTKEAIALAARNEAPNECCGFVIDGEVVSFQNVHSSPLTNFAISAEDYARAEELGNIDAIFHSHVNGINGFSKHDIKACKQSNVPWIIYNLGTHDFHYADPTGEAPYEEREWVYGIHDCYGLMRDFYKKEFNIVLDDFERLEEEEWAKPDWTRFADNFEAQGFYEVAAPEQKGDVALMCLQSGQGNHVGIMAGQGNRFYHHLSNRLSRVSIYGGYWAKVTVKVYRHKDVP